MCDKKEKIKPSVYICSDCGHASISDRTVPRSWNMCHRCERYRYLNLLEEKSKYAYTYDSIYGVTDPYKSVFDNATKFKIVRHRIKKNVHMSDIIKYIYKDRRKNINKVVESYNKIRKQFVSREKLNTYILEFDMQNPIKKDKVIFYLDGERQKGWKANCRDIFGFGDAKAVLKQATVFNPEKIKYAIPGYSIKDYIDFFLENPYMEILVKAGYYYKEGEYGTTVINKINHLVNIHGTTPTDILRLNKPKAKFIKEYSQNKLSNYGYSYGTQLYDLLAVLQDDSISLDKFKRCLEFTYGYFENCTQMKNINVGYCNAPYLAKLFKFANDEGYDAIRLVRYLSEDVKEHQGIYNFNNAFDTLKDYVITSKTLEMPYEKYPRALALNHDRIVYLKLLKADEYAQKRFMEAREENSRHDYSNKEFMTISPKNIPDIKREGSELSHCVGTYVDRYASRTARIFFMRKVSEPNKAYVTIELSEHYGLVQAKGFANRAVTEKESRFINEFIESINLSRSEGVA